jgi:hypothetical protein
MLAKFWMLKRMQQNNGNYLSIEVSYFRCLNNGNYCPMRIKLFPRCDWISGWTNIFPNPKKVKVERSFLIFYLVMWALIQKFCRASPSGRQNTTVDGLNCVHMEEQLPYKINHTALCIQTLSKCPTKIADRFQLNNIRSIYLCNL